MIKLLDGFPSDVVAASATGLVTGQDYETVLIPRVEAVARTNEKIRCYYEIGPDFSGMAPGAMLEDLRVGVGYWTRWDRVAVITDVAWITQVVNAFRFLMPGSLRVFPSRDKEAASAWIKAA